MRGVQEAGVLLGGGKLEDLIASQNEFSHQIHQLIQQAHVDTYVAVGKGRSAGFRLHLQRVLYGGGLGGALLHQDFAETAVVTVVLKPQRLIDFLRISPAGLHQYFSQGWTRIRFRGVSRPLLSDRGDWSVSRG